MEKAKKSAAGFDVHYTFESTFPDQLHFPRLFHIPP